MPKSRVTAERWTQIEELFHRVAECSPEHRAAMLDDYCRDDAELRRQVEALLSCDGNAGDSVQAAVRDGLDDVGFPLTGETISHYHILDGLGGGGMGLVYRAEDIKLGRRVALKFLPEESVKDPAALGRFEREARSASALEHPSICPIYEFGEHEGQPFLVMQLLEGQTLRELISAAGPGKPPLELSRLLDLAIQIVEGLDAAHQKGIIHRDIKPANIFITREGQAKILDFGLAKLASLLSADLDDLVQGPRGEGDREGALVGTAPLSTPDLFLSRTGMAIGTAGYMSPEQVRGEKLDARSDLFSFGLVLYEMATGRRAFTGDTGPELHEAILSQMPCPARQVNPKLPAKLEQIIHKALEKGREARYQTAAEIRSDLMMSNESSWHNAAVASFSRLRQRPWNWILGGAAVVAVMALTLVIVLRMRKPPPMNEADLVLVADFVNTTGDPVFDGTLKQALAVKLAESPYFNIESDTTTRKTLGLMGRSADDRVVPPISRDLCQREGAKVVVGGSVLSFGNKYVVELEATNCLTGASVAHQQIEALDREQVLSKLGQVIPPLRRRLGESVSSIQKFDTPIAEATTKSLAALKAFTSGVQKRAQGQEAESIPFFKMAIELDPDFVMAYAGLSSVNANLQQPDLAKDYLQKAFERRAHATEREKLSIQANYYSNVTRETDKVIEIYKLWADAYSHDFVPFVNLANEYFGAGQLQNAVEAGQQAMRLNPHHAASYGCLGQAYQHATRFAEAKATAEKAVAEKLDNWTTHRILYEIAFVEADEPTMQREVDWFKGKPAEGVGTYYQAKAALSLGELRKARELFERAGAIAQRNGLKEQVIAINNGQAQFEADLGNAREARAMADRTLRESPNSARHKAFATLALARAGDIHHAEAAVNELNKLPRPGTALSKVVLPSVRAAVDLNRKNPAAAIEELRSAIPYDLGADSAGVTLYYRGLAYLELRSGKEAAAQFQKILDNRGVVIVDVYWPLARLGLARAYAQTGDKEKSLAQYRELLTFWENADPDLRLLKEAKSEYKVLSARPVNAEAHEAYLMGRFYWNKRTHDDIVTGLSYFQKAVSLDPKDPHGYAGIADSYIALGGTEWLPPGEAFSKAKEAALRALALDDALAEAHSALGQAYQAERDWAAAEKECKRALALNPGYTMAHWRYSFFLSKVGRHDEAIAEAKRARELDPLLLFANVVLGQALYHARRYDESQQVLLKALEQEPASYTASTVLASTYAQKRMFRESIAALERVPRSSSADVMIRAPLGYDYAKLGKNRDAELLLKELGDESRRKYVSAYFVSWVCIGLGRNEEAIQWLEQAYRQDDYQLTWLGVDPIFDPLRSDPRFAALIRRLGLPQQASLKQP